MDENIGRAQRRDAARQEKFYFRKSVYALGRNGSDGSTTSSPDSSSSVNDGFFKKEKKLGNCFPPLPVPLDGVKFTSPIEDEYEEMSMNEIINGKVLADFLQKCTYLPIDRERISLGFCSSCMIIWISWTLIEMPSTELRNI